MELNDSNLKVELRRAIASLGRSSRSAEAELVNARIRGIPGDGCRCILAEYLTRKMQQAVGVDLRVDVFHSRLIITCHVGRLSSFGAVAPYLQLLLRKFDTHRLDPRLYPKIARWTPEIGGWQYPIYQCGQLLSTHNAPVEFRSRVFNGRCAGWRINAGWARYLTPREAYAAHIAQERLRACASPS